MDEDEKSKEEAETETPEKEEASEETEKKPVAFSSLEEATAEYRKLQALVASLKSETITRRLKLREYEKKEEEQRKAAMTETERLQTELAAATKGRAEAEARLLELTLRTQVETIARKLHFIKPWQAYALADLSDVAYDEEKGQYDQDAIEKLLKVLARDNDNLIEASDSENLGTPKRTGRQPPVKSEPTVDSVTVKGPVAARL